MIFKTLLSRTLFVIIKNWSHEINKQNSRI